MAETKKEVWVGFDLGGTKMLAVIYDEKFKVLGRKRRRTKGHEGQDAGLARMGDTIDMALEDAGVSVSDIRGIGVGCPGPLDLDKGVIHEAPNLGWEEAPVRTVLEKRFKCPAIIANDVDVGLYGEYRFGAAKGAHCALGIFPGTGIGGGCIYEGRIFRGKRSSCMEVGFMHFMPDGPRAGAGARGTLEAVASRLAVSGQAAQAAYRGQAPHLRKLAGTDVSEIRSGVIAKAIEEGDKEIERIVAQAAGYVGQAVGSLVNLLAPDIVVLGGGLVEANPKVYLPNVEKLAEATVLPSFRGSYKVVLAELGDDSASLGAAADAGKPVKDHMTTTHGSSGSATNANGTPRPVAVIDVGTSAIRMAIAEIHPDGHISPLERLIQGVSLGKDTFSRGSIRKSTIDACVDVLTAYREKLNEYRVTSPDQIRVVATSAVREARNRLAFLDRIFSATGFWVDPISEAEISRVTYLGLLPLLRSEEALHDAQVLVTEVGGGSTEVLMLKSEDVVHSRTYRLGSLRLKESLVGSQASRANARRMLENQIDRTIDMIRTHIDKDSPVELLALGGDIRFAASQLLSDCTPGTLHSLSVRELARFADEMLELSEDQIVQRYHLTLPDAESLGPALLTYLRLARELRLKRILITDFNLREALLSEMAGNDGWSPNFIEQIIRSARDLGKKFRVDDAHATHVARLSKKLFRALANEHRLGRRWEVILCVAALLHEAGLFVATSSYHKHSMYLIENSEIFGLGLDDVSLVALVARYHRRAFPKPSHDPYRALGRNDRVAVTQVAAILRVADGLDHSRSQRVQDINCERDGDRFLISVDDVRDLSLEQIALKQSGILFEETFGRRILLRSA